MSKLTVSLTFAFLLLAQHASGEPPTVDQVKEAFAKAIVASGYKVGDTTNAVIEREAPRIAETIEDQKNVQIFVGKTNGVEHGFCYSLYPNHQIQRMGYFRHGKRIGPWRFFFPDGSLSAKLQYDNDGNEIGQHVAYLRNGNIHYVETYADGLKNGPKTSFYDDGGTHMHQLHQLWQKGQMHGLSVIYYPNGAVKKMSSWSNGRQHGNVIFYDEAGNVTEQAQYINGQKK